MHTHRGLWKDTLTPAEEAIVAYTASNGKRYSKTREEIARHVRCSVQTVIERLPGLIERGWVMVEEPDPDEEWTREVAPRYYSTMAVRHHLARYRMIRDDPFTPAPSNVRQLLAQRLGKERAELLLSHGPGTRKFQGA